MHRTHMDFELQRRMDGAVHKCLGEQRNAVTEIQKMYSTSLIARSRKSRKFVAATEANGNQASEFSKVHWQVGFDSVPGTRIREPCHNCESESSAGDCVVLRMRKVY